jgi:hypothetical protein
VTERKEIVEDITIADNKSFALGHSNVAIGNGAIGMSWAEPPNDETKEKPRWWEFWKWLSRRESDR